jgi:hypothetical protein
MYMLSATQNVDGLLRRLSAEDVDNMLSNYSSLVSFATGNKATDEYIQKRMGEIWRAKAEGYEGQPDFQADLSMYEIDPPHDHDEIHVYMPEGVRPTRLAHAVGMLDANDRASIHLHEATDRQEPKFKGLIELVPVVHANEISGLLSRKGTAIAIVMRGGVERHDVIRMNAFERINKAQDVEDVEVREVETAE